MVLGVNDKFNLPDLLKDLNNKKSAEIHGCEINNLNYISSFSLSERTRSFLKIQDEPDYPLLTAQYLLQRKNRSDNIKNILKNKKIFLSLE